MRDATPWYAFDTHVVGTYQEERGLRIARSMFDCTLYRVSLLPYPPTTFPTPPFFHPCHHPGLLLPDPPPPSPSLSLPLTFIDLFGSRDFDSGIGIPPPIPREEKASTDNDTTPTRSALEEDRVKAIEQIRRRSY